MTTGKDWEALAAAVKERRTLLRYRQADLAALGGPSEGTMKNIEQAARTTYSPRTLSQLERVLEFQDGAVDRILTGTATEEDLQAPTLRSTGAAPVSEAVPPNIFAGGQAVGDRARTLEAAIAAAGAATPRAHPMPVSPAAAAVHERTRKLALELIDWLNHYYGNIPKIIQDAEPGLFRLIAHTIQYPEDVHPDADRYSLEN